MAQWPAVRFGAVTGVAEDKGIYFGKYSEWYFLHIEQWSTVRYGGVAGCIEKGRRIFQIYIYISVRYFHPRVQWSSGQWYSDWLLQSNQQWFNCQKKGIWYYWNIMWQVFPPQSSAVRYGGVTGMARGRSQNTDGYINANIFKFISSPSGRQWDWLEPE